MKVIYAGLIRRKINFFCPFINIQRKISIFVYLPCKDKLSFVLHGSELDDLMQLSHRASKLLHNLFNSESILKAQAHGKKITHSLHKQTVPETAEYLCFFYLKRKKCFISSHRKAHQAEKQLTKQISRPLEVKNKAL